MELPKAAPESTATTGNSKAAPKKATALAGGKVKK